MSRRRKTNRGLPRRVYIKHGSYRYFSPVKIRDPKDGKLKSWITLCNVVHGESAMLMALALLIGGPRNETGSMPYLCGEFKENKLDDYEDETKATYKRYLDLIADKFVEFHAANVTTKDVADFLRMQFKGKPNTAKKYAALMTKLFKYAIGELGLRQDNPIDQIDLSGYKSGTRKVLATHAQVKAIREAGMQSTPRKDTKGVYDTQSGPMFACLIDMSYLVWQRAIDIRLLKESQIDDGRIRFRPSKTIKSSGKTVDITITPGIQAVIDAARAIKKDYGVISPYLFPTKKGRPYAKSGLFSMWDRARTRAGITEDVTFRDIRALGATDAAKAGAGMESIKTRLAHTSSRTSEIYIKESVPEASSIDLALPWKAV